VVLGEKEHIMTARPRNMDPWLTVKQVAEDFQVSTDLVYQAVWRKELEAQPIGRRGWRIRESSVRAWQNWLKDKRRA